jgi:murein L,D-transpeptidase YafK
MLAQLEHNHMSKESPILVRLFKEEAELEVWKKDSSGRFALLKTSPSISVTRTLLTAHTAERAETSWYTAIAHRAVATP